MDYTLKECLNCLTWISMDAAKCEHCNSFQMHVDFQFMDRKMEGFDGLSELRYMTEMKLKQMSGKFDDADIKLFQVQQEAKQEYFKNKLMHTIETNEPFILN